MSNDDRLEFLQSCIEKVKNASDEDIKYYKEVFNRKPDKIERLKEDGNGHTERWLIKMIVCKVNEIIDYINKNCQFHWVVIFINFQEIIKKDDKIIEIKLSRYFYTDEEFKNLENKGFLVSWMEDNIKNEEEIFDIVIPE